MSPAAESAVPPAPLDVQALERKLIALRGEIDAILAQLAETVRPAAIALASQDASSTAAVPSTAPPATENMPGESATGDAELACRAHTSESTRSSLDAAAQDGAPGTPERVPPPVEAERATERSTSSLTAALAACEGTSSESDECALMPVAPAQPNLVADTLGAIDLDCGAATEATSIVASAPKTRAAEQATAEMPLAGTPDTSVRVISQADAAPAPASEAPRAEPLPVAVAPPGVAPEPAAASPEATPSDTASPTAPVAAVISLEPRRHKQKADHAISRPMAAPRGRRLARRVAAGIIALIAAGGALMLAEREAMGGSQAFPWVSPLPSYQMPWSLFGPQKQGAVERSVSAVGSVAAAEAVLARYRDVWPMSP
jgi:hypothetical protein